MKFSIVTFYDDQRRDFGDLTAPVARQYAMANGYGYACYRDSLVPARAPHWSKIAALERELHGDFDWLLWLDADALIVQPRIRLHEIVTNFGQPNSELLFSSDKNGLCTGVFLVRNSEWSRSFLQAVSLLGEIPECGHLREQLTVRHLWEHFPEVRSRTALIPDSVVQNPESKFCGEAFIMHYWAATKPFNQHQQKILSITYHGWNEQYF